MTEAESSELGDLSEELALCMCVFLRLDLHNAMILPISISLPSVYLVSTPIFVCFYLSLDDSCFPDLSLVPPMC